MAESLAWLPEYTTGWKHWLAQRLDAFRAATGHDDALERHSSRLMAGKVLELWENYLSSQGEQPTPAVFAEFVGELGGALPPLLKFCPHLVQYYPGVLPLAKGDSPNGEVTSPILLTVPELYYAFIGLGNKLVNSGVLEIRRRRYLDEDLDE
jgi:hypothetical protein